jgi:hypothetical protein
MSFLLLAAAAGHAQAPPSPPPPQAPRPFTGFVSSYEIMRTVRSAGFDPLARPLREGTTYVLHATDFRGVLMRVVVDARTGVIRDVTRIVPGPGTYAPIGMAPPPYRLPPEFDAPAAGLAPAAESAAPPLSQLPASRTATRPAPAPAESAPLPLPPALASRKPADAVNSGAKTDPKTGASSGANSGRKTGADSDTNSDATAVAPSKALATAPLSD